MPRLHSGTANDRPEPTKVPPIPQFVWQQPQQTHLTNIHKTSNTGVHKNTYMPEFRRRNDVESQTSPIKEASLQVSGACIPRESNWEHASTEPQ